MLRVPDHQVAGHHARDGTQLVEASNGSGLHPHLVLQDLTSNCLNPSVMDNKIGCRTWYPESSEDYIKKCLKRDGESTSVALGFRKSGLQVYESEEASFWRPDRERVKKLSAEDTELVLRKFVSSNSVGDWDSVPDCSLASAVYGGSTGILAHLLELKSWFEDQTIFHFYSCSPLLMYDKESVLKEGGVRVHKSSLLTLHMSSKAEVLLIITSWVVSAL